jgi:hypothetical protein
MVKTDEALGAIHRYRSRFSVALSAFIKHVWPREFRRRSAALLLALLPFVPVDAKSAPANSLRELYSTLGECVKGPFGTPGSELTIIFSIRRDGSLNGKPRISHAKLLGDSRDQSSFVADVAAALERCLPVDITPGLGGATAGRPIILRVVSRPRGKDI